MPCRARSTSDTTRTPTLTSTCQHGAAQNAVGRCRGPRDIPMRGCGAVSSGAGWTPTPNALCLWWISRTRPIPGSTNRRRPVATRRAGDAWRPDGGVGPRCCNLLIWVVQRQQPRESLCLNAYLMNHWSRSSIRVCLADVANTVGCRAEMTTSSRWRPSVTEWPQAWRTTRLTTCRLRQTLRRQEFPKPSIWRSEGCWATPPSTRRTADSAVLRFRRL